jgi:hypothetical protein
MAYMLLVVEQRGQRDTRSMDQGKHVYQRMLDYTESLKAKDVLIASNSLRSDAVRLNVRDGKSRVIDGPFTEAKEFIGGFFLLTCATRDEALAIASECPAAEWATIEVRPVGPCYE